MSQTPPTAGFFHPPAPSGTRDIEALEGRDLDVAVAYFALGMTLRSKPITTVEGEETTAFDFLGEDGDWHRLPYYSTDRCVAYMLLEDAAKTHSAVTLTVLDDGSAVCSVGVRTSKAETGPRAICAAFLQAVLDPS